MQYWFWWNLKCGLNNYVELKFPEKSQLVTSKDLQTLIYLDMPLGGGSKIHVIKGLYLMKDFMEQPTKKVSLQYEVERYKKKNQISLRSFLSEKQVCFYFQLFYTKILMLYNLRKLKMNNFVNESGLIIFTLQDMVGVTKSYDLFKWSYQLKINTYVTKKVVNHSQVNVFYSYFILLK